MNKTRIAELLETCRELDAQTEGRSEHKKFNEYDSALSELQTEIGWGDYSPISWDYLEAAAETIGDGGTPKFPETAKKK